VSSALHTDAEELWVPHTVQTGTTADKTELNDYSIKNRVDPSFLAVSQIVIHLCHYSYSKEGIKDNRKLGKKRVINEYKAGFAIDFNSRYIILMLLSYLVTSTFLSTVFVYLTLPFAL
jgi:hypothetical protein